ncbi:MAG: hypothetical protein ACFB8W_24665 [Elainellaceae cyanobacterium]
MKRLSWKVLVAIAIGVFAVGAIASLPRTMAQGGWQAAKSAPSSLIQQVAAENVGSTSPIDVSQMRVWKIRQSGQSVPLYLIDTRTTDPENSAQANPLCGALGCAFLGYLPGDEGYQQVLGIYLDPNLPPNIPLFQLSEALHNELPILQVKQLEGHQIQQLTLTFNGQEYEVTQAELLSQRYE